MDFTASWKEEGRAQWEDLYSVLVELVLPHTLFPPSLAIFWELGFVCTFTQAVSSFQTISSLLNAETSV